MSKLISKILAGIRTGSNLSMEDIGNGKVVRELEYTYYGRLMNTEILDKAFRVEKQEQWSILIDKDSKNRAGGSVRVRKTIVVENGVDGEPTYVLTAKAKMKAGDCAEVGIDVTEDMFKVFRAIASSGMIKTRYMFYQKDINPVSIKAPFVIEVDVFAGTEWVKIDVEGIQMPGGGITPPAEIDYFEKGILDNVISGVKKDRSPEDEQKLDELYQNTFVS